MIMDNCTDFVITVHAMPRYPRYRRRYRRRCGPAYSVTRKLIKAGAFSAFPILNTMQPRLKYLTVIYVGSIVTVKHIEVKLANLPTYFINEDQQIKGVWSVR